MGEGVPRGALLAALVALAVVAAVVLARNGLVRRRHEIDEARAQVDVQLRRRHDLVPALTAAVRGHLEHERETLERVARARAAAAAELGGAAGRATEAENELTAAITPLRLVLGAVPALRGADVVLRLQEDLVSTENRIAFARQFHNEEVLRFNTARAVFPRVLVALACGIRPAGYLRLELPLSDVP